MTNKQEREPSKSYTIQSFKGVILKLEALKMADEKDLKTLKEIHKKVVTLHLQNESF